MSDAIQKSVHAAIGRLFEADIQLFQVDANERTIAQRLAVYIAEEFPGWNVHCEYNRNREEIKRMSYARFGEYRMHNVVPDIIVHRAGTSENLLVIELKKTTNHETDAIDIGKIQAYKEQLGYSAAAFFRLRAGSDGIGIENEYWASDA